VRRQAGALLAASAVVVLGAGAVVTSGPTSSPAAAQSILPPTGTASITPKTLVATTQVDGTLGYADTYTVSNSLATSASGSGGGGGDAQLAYASAKVQYHQALAALNAFGHPMSAHVRKQLAQDALTAAKAALDAASARLDQPRGVLTQVAWVGSVVQPGTKLYTLDGDHPVVLMSGAVPAWRDLELGVADGIDVKQLETNLRAFGYAGDALTVDGHWNAATTTAVKAWQKTLGVAQTGVVALGEVVFEPSALRITADSASMGATVQTGTPILGATSTTPVVAVALDPALQTKVTAGDAVSVTMPDGSTMTGTVSDVGTVATVPQGDRSQGSNPMPTINVTIALDGPSSTGGLDQAPVSVNITTATADNVLAVPVSALVDLLEGGYAVQVQADDGTLHYVRVQLGLFANGWVEVSGQGLSEGQTVVVAQ
jgi:peptidoglycan hydrolase-like protein with peptidoglycan-binding domain